MISDDVTHGEGSRQKKEKEGQKKEANPEIVNVELITLRFQLTNGINKSNQMQFVTCWNLKS